MISPLVLPQSFSLSLECCYMKGWMNLAIGMASILLFSFLVGNGPGHG